MLRRYGCPAVLLRQQVPMMPSLVGSKPATGLSLTKSGVLWYIPPLHYLGLPIAGHFTNVNGTKT